VLFDDRKTDFQENYQICGFPRAKEQLFSRNSSSANPNFNHSKDFASTYVTAD
jgi:hypothetical protein